MIPVLFICIVEGFFYHTYMCKVVSSLSECIYRFCRMDELFVVVQTFLILFYTCVSEQYAFVYTVVDFLKF